MHGDPTTTFIEVWKETFKYRVKIIFTQGTRCPAMNSKKKFMPATQQYACTSYYAKPTGFQEGLVSPYDSRDKWSVQVAACLAIIWLNVVTWALAMVTRHYALSFLPIWCIQNLSKRYFRTPGNSCISILQAWLACKNKWWRSGSYQRQVQRQVRK